MERMSVNNEIVHLLGYITKEQWVDTLSETFGLNKEIIYELMCIQEKAYGTELIIEVEAIIEERKKKGK